MNRHPSSPTPRPRRQSPEATRARLIEAAAECFNTAGLTGVDASRIAAAAGYANGTFYKHFKDKREALVAAYDAMIAAEWEEVNAVLLSGGQRHAVAERIVTLGIALHVRWRGLRAAMVALVATDEDAGAAYRIIRLRQLETMEAMRRTRGVVAKEDREADALLLLTLERGYDALANREVETLGMDADRFAAHLRALVAAAL